MDKHEAKGKSKSNNNSDQQKTGIWPDIWDDNSFEDKLDEQEKRMLEEHDKMMKNLYALESQALDCLLVVDLMVENGSPNDHRFVLIPLTEITEEEWAQLNMLAKKGGIDYARGKLYEWWTNWPKVRQFGAAVSDLSGNIRSFRITKQIFIASEYY